MYWEKSDPSGIEFFEILRGSERPQMKIRFYYLAIYIYKSKSIISTKRENVKTRGKRKLKDGDRYFREVFSQHISQAGLRQKITEHVNL
jgi:hypothetical protein